MVRVLGYDGLFQRAMTFPAATLSSPEPLPRRFRRIAVGAGLSLGVAAIYIALTSCSASGTQLIRLPFRGVLATAAFGTLIGLIPIHHRAPSKRWKWIASLVFSVLMLPLLMWLMVVGNFLTQECLPWP